MSNPLRVTLNGESRELPAEITIAELIVLLEVRGRYAVEVNGDIVPRSAHLAHRLADGDRIEVVAAIGGG
jgi:sulfur carrier protein